MRFVWHCDESEGSSGDEDEGREHTRERIIGAESVAVTSDFLDATRRGVSFAGVRERIGGVKGAVKNPFAVCHSALGPGKTMKYERCVQALKRRM